MYIFIPMSEGPCECIILVKHVSCIFEDLRKTKVPNRYNVITNGEATLDAQEDLLILEKERNLELQELLSNKYEMLEVLIKEMSLVKITIKDKEKEMAIAKTSTVSLANEKEALESSLLSLTFQN
jgi:hypothetical protein